MDAVVECPHCKWTGKRSQLKLCGSVTYADEWWQCPVCGVEARHMIVPLTVKTPPP